MDKRDIGSEILDGLKAIKQGQGTRKVVKIPDVIAIRKSMNANQSVFAAMLGVMRVPFRTGNKVGVTPLSPH